MNDYHTHTHLLPTSSPIRTGHLILISLKLAINHTHTKLITGLITGTQNILSTTLAATLAATNLGASFNALPH